MYKDVAFVDYQLILFSGKGDGSRKASATFFTGINFFLVAHQIAHQNVQVAFQVARTTGTPANFFQHSTLPGVLVVFLRLHVPRPPPPQYTSRQQRCVSTQKKGWSWGRVGSGQNSRTWAKGAKSKDGRGNSLRRFRRGANTLLQKDTKTWVYQHFCTKNGSVKRRKIARLDRAREN